MPPAWQEKMYRAAQKSLAVMCPACSPSPEGLLALMKSANRGLKNYHQAVLDFCNSIGTNRKSAAAAPVPLPVSGRADEVIE